MNINAIYCPIFILQIDKLWIINFVMEKQEAWSYLHLTVVVSLMTLQNLQKATKSQSGIVLTVILANTVINILYSYFTKYMCNKKILL